MMSVVQDCSHIHTHTGSQLNIGLSLPSMQASGEI